MKWPSGKNYESTPDRKLVGYLLYGMKFRFRIGFDHKVTTSKATKNMKSILDNPEPARMFLHNELQVQRIVGTLLCSLSKKLEFAPVASAITAVHRDRLKF